MSTEKHLFVRWVTVKGFAAIILFIIVATLAEYIVVLYALSLGVRDQALLQWGFTFPGTDGALTLVISPLFHLVPLTVIISLGFSWLCLTKYMAIRPIETRRTKVEIPAKRGQKRRLRGLRRFFGRIKLGILKIKGISYMWKRVHFARATTKSALTVLLVFLVFAFVTSLFTYPNLIYDTFANAYKNDPSLLSSVSNTSQFFASLGGVFSGINDALCASALGLRDFIVTLGLLTKPLGDLDNAGKYLFFQNAAAWISALAVLFYGEYRLGYRHRKIRRS